MISLFLFWKQLTEDRHALQFALIKTFLALGCCMLTINETPYQIVVDWSDAVGDWFGHEKTSTKLNRPMSEPTPNAKSKNLKSISSGAAKFKMSRSDKSLYSIC